jgi:hypothetical protein
MCHDRSDGDQLELTHEFMSTVLTVRRSGVTVTLHSLEATGAIRGTRGVVQIVNRSRLEEIAGISYGVPEQEYGRLIGAFAKGSLSSAWSTSGRLPLRRPSKRPFHCSPHPKCVAAQACGTCKAAAPAP